MFAIFKSAGTQHKVSVGDVLSLQKIESPVGTHVEFKEVCLLEDPRGHIKIGAPTITGAAVEAEIVRQYRDKKVRVVKFRRRKHSMKCQGHRQALTEIKIIQIKV